MDSTSAIGLELNGKEVGACLSYGVGVDGKDQRKIEG